MQAVSIEALMSCSARIAQCEMVDLAVAAPPIMREVVKSLFI